MPCLLVMSMLFLGPYAYIQLRMARTLIYLLRHPSSIAQFGLSSRYTASLCLAPGGMLLLLTFTMLAFGPSPRHGGNFLVMMTFTGAGAAFALVSWVAMSLWLRRILRRDLAVYREPAALVPVVILAMICLMYTAIVGWTTRHMWPGFGGGLGAADIFLAIIALLLLTIPAVPLANFILVIVHVACIRAAGTWELTAMPEPDEEDAP